MSWIVPRISYFYFGGSSASAWSGGDVSWYGFTAPQPFAVGGSRSYPEFWAITCGP
jgi:hypothetical protein